MLPRAEPQTAPQQSRMEIEKYIVATDQQLIEFVLGGDSIAFEHLFNRYRDSIYQLYIQRTGGNVDDTNDLLQETFVKVFLKLHTYNPEHTFGKWVYTIARNTFIDFTRRRRDDTFSIDRAGETTGSLPAPGRPHAGRADDHTTRMPRPARTRFLSKNVAPRYRELIELRFFKEYSYEEIAAELQLPMGTVKTQIHRAREQLCRYITGKRIALKPHPVRSQPFSYPLIPRSRTFWTGSLPTKRTILRIPASVELADSRPACGINEPLQTCKLEAETVRKQ